MSPPEDPRPKIVGDIDLRSAKGLEIGPLYNPRLLKTEADIRYLDHVSTAELREKYADNPDAGAHLEDLVEVDYVCRPPATLLDAVGADAPFDFVVASHVIEHIPNVVGWLQEVTAILADGGMLSLVVPDKRYTFDANRGLTTMADLVDAHLRDLRMPSFRQMYDFAANLIAVDADELWAGGDVSARRREDVNDPDVFAYEFCADQQRTGEYQDVHCSTFTPDSLADLIARLTLLGLTDLAVDRMHPTKPGELEFFVMLRKVPGDELATMREEVARTWRPPAIVDAKHLPAGHTDMQLSGREQQLVLAKRRAAAKARALRARVRR